MTTLAIDSDNRITGRSNSVGATEPVVIGRRFSAAVLIFFMDSPLESRLPRIGIRLPPLESRAAEPWVSAVPAPMTSVFLTSVYTHPENQVYRQKITMTANPFAPQMIREMCACDLPPDTVHSLSSIPSFVGHYFERIQNPRVKFDMCLVGVLTTRLKPTGFEIHFFVYDNIYVRVTRSLDRK